MQQKSCFQTRLEIEIAIKEEDEKKVFHFWEKAARKWLSSHFRLDS